MAVHSLDCCLPETEGDVRPWQYTVWTAVCLPETEDDARPWQYTVWTAVRLRLRVMLGHGSTQSGLVSA